MLLAPQLKDATRELHAQLDNHPTLRRLLAADLSLAEYKSILALMYGFMEPLEEVLLRQKHIDWQGYGIDWTARRKKPWFEADFAVLGMDSQKLLCWQELPPPASPGEAWGYLYVVEGSTLGAQFISRQIKRSLALGADAGGRYYAGYGSQTGEMWQQFHEGLEAWYAHSADHHGPLAAAQRAFASLAAWFAQAPRLHGLPTCLA